jgi:hypothetical protein
MSNEVLYAVAQLTAVMVALLIIVGGMAVMEWRERRRRLCRTGTNVHSAARGTTPGRGATARTLVRGCRRKEMYPYILSSPQRKCAARNLQLGPSMPGRRAADG